MKIKAKLTRSFTQNPEYGNPAGVVRDANQLSDEQILKAAQILGFPESAFIQKSDIADMLVLQKQIEALKELKSTDEGYIGTAGGGLGTIQSAIQKVTGLRF